MKTKLTLLLIISLLIAFIVVREHKFSSVKVMTKERINEWYMEGWSVGFDAGSLTPDSVVARRMFINDIAKLNDELIWLE